MFETNITGRSTMGNGGNDTPAGLLLLLHSHLATRMFWYICPADQTAFRYRKLPVLSSMRIEYLQEGNTGIWCTGRIVDSSRNIWRRSEFDEFVCLIA